MYIYMYVYISVHTYIHIGTCMYAFVYIYEKSPFPQSHTQRYHCKHAAPLSLTSFALSHFILQIKICACCDQLDCYLHMALVNRLHQS